MLIKPCSVNPPHINSIHLHTCKPSSRSRYGSVRCRRINNIYDRYLSIVWSITHQSRNIQQNYTANIINSRRYIWQIRELTYCGNTDLFFTFFKIYVLSSGDIYVYFWKLYNVIWKFMLVNVKDITNETQWVHIFFWNYR